MCVLQRLRKDSNTSYSFYCFLVLKMYSMVLRCFRLLVLLMLDSPRGVGCMHSLQLKVSLVFIVILKGPNRTWHEGTGMAIAFDPGRVK